MIITTAIINYDCHVTLKAEVMMLNYHRNKLQFNVKVILKENEIGSFCDSQTFFFNPFRRSPHLALTLLA